MLASGYETQFNESLRYWRTRFVVIPTDEPPPSSVGPLGEKLNDEEIRLLGMDKLAELFSKVRWLPPDERNKQYAPVRFLPTDLGPTQCILDESLIAQLDDIHAAGPLRKKMKSERDIADTSLASIAKAMREEDGVTMKDRRWHGRVYANCFTGADMVNWLVREFRDVPTREVAQEWGAKLQEQGLFEHCRGMHGFLDGHYFYALKGEYLVPMTPRGGWFGRSSRHVAVDDTNSRPGMGSNSSKSATGGTKKPKKKLILSQSMIIDIDPNKVGGIICTVCC
jgi:DEP domain-containing protein 5